jgi:predicted RNase H-like HicB family nuclease
MSFWFLNGLIFWRLFGKLGYLLLLEGVKMAKEFTVIIEQDEEGYYIAEVPELKGCHTQAKSLDTLMERVKEAIQLCLEVYGKKYPITHLVGVQKIAL